METQTVAASRCLEQLENLIADAFDGNARFGDVFLQIVVMMRSRRVVGTAEERRQLRREIVRDALGLGLRHHVSVRTLIRQLAREPAGITPQAASPSGAAIAHRFGPCTDRICT